MDEKMYPVADIRQLVIQALVHHNSSRRNAEAVADALIAAEMDGLRGHGLSRLVSYCGQAASGKVDGNAEPVATRVRGAAVRVDAGNGFAYPAMELAVSELTALAPEMGVAVAAITNSHHCGAAGYHVEKLAREGLVGLLFANTPKAIAPWGGSQALFGTNPIAFGVPGKDREPMVIDLALSKVARGKIMVASKENRDIPEGWALDSEGNPTTDSARALGGTMLPMGDAKGAALVLMVEILAAAVTGSNFGYEASSFFEADGKPPNVGQLLMAISPGPLSGEAFYSRIEALFAEILGQDNTRLPGERRLGLRDEARQQGLKLNPAEYKQLRQLAAA
ncbi:Ldh family oxidoreductase [Desulfosediminicola sp.]|uniref:Ldh family oxidoreductase n=1 Tax=Desulfosediminicola sp. TaxID=2886825 RepID=UPI003AF233FE